MILNQKDRFYNLYEGFKEISNVVKYENTDYLNKEINQSNSSEDIIKQIDLISNNIMIKQILPSVILIK